MEMRGRRGQGEGGRGGEGEEEEKEDKEKGEVENDGEDDKIKRCNQPITKTEMNQKKKKQWKQKWKKR